VHDVFTQARWILHALFGVYAVKNYQVETTTQSLIFKTLISLILLCANLGMSISDATKRRWKEKGSKGKTPIRT
jgi:uncharacterized membrane protein YhfC